MIYWALYFLLSVSESDSKKNIGHHKLYRIKYSHKYSQKLSLITGFILYINRLSTANGQILTIKFFFSVDKKILEFI
jgi:hypothetical protein